MIPFQFHADAEAEFVDGFSYYEKQLVGLGEIFVAEVERAITLARTFPDAGSPVGKRLRQTIVRRFPYAIIWRTDAACLLVLAVAHQSRRPGYWRERAKK